MKRYTGPIHAGDWFDMSREGEAFQRKGFVFERHGDMIELRSYRSTTDSEPPTIRLVSIETLRRTPRIPNECGTILVKAEPSLETFLTGSAS